MKKFIVITSIHNPTIGIQAFKKQEDFEVVVVGDLKTASDWKEEGVVYLSVDKQNEMESRLCKMLPFNHYARKMTGYIYAIGSGAKQIIDTDDDNIPKKDWGFPGTEGIFSGILPGSGFINIYQWFSGQPIWPRGLPLSLIKTDFCLEDKLYSSDFRIGIWQALADEDPDVDAIYRITNNNACYFNDREPVVLGKSTLSPFNSQNTLFVEELFPLLYLPAYVNFRFTDILRGLVAQPIMWLYDYHLGFAGASVVQKRNPHNYFDDFIDEMPMYRHAGNIPELVSSVISEKESMTVNLFNAYSALEKNDIIIAKELHLLEAWLYDLEKLKTNLK